MLEGETAFIHKCDELEEMRSKVDDFGKELKLECVRNFGWYDFCIFLMLHECSSMVCKQLVFFRSSHPAVHVEASKTLKKETFHIPSRGK